MKFGGTSVRDADSRAAALSHVRRARDEGHSLALVVSAMGRKGEPYATDSLIALLQDIGPSVSARELDLAMACGEILSAAFFAQLLISEGIPARAFTGPQAGVLVSKEAGQAEILSVDPARIKATLDAGEVAVLAGFQGADKNGEIRTLGRGGSDTSALALGAALSAETVEIYSDVEGIASADPRRIPEARFLEEIRAEELLLMADEGSRVIHPRALRTAIASGTKLRARNTFSKSPGTLIHHREDLGKARPLALAHRDRQVLLHLPDSSADILPELISIGGGRFLLLDDVYLGERLKRLQEAIGDFEFGKGWATASLVYSGPVPDQPECPAKGEALPSGGQVCRWLCRESDLDEVLRDLYPSIR